MQNQKYIGRRLQVLVDREEEDCFVGRTQYDSPEVDGEVLIKNNPEIQVGEFYTVKITGSSEFDLFGKVVL